MNRRNVIQDKNGQMICPYFSEVFIRLALLVKTLQRFTYLVVLHFYTFANSSQSRFLIANAYFQLFKLFQFEFDIKKALSHAYAL